MNLRSFLPAAALLLTTAATHSALAQSAAGPERRPRHYDKQGRLYYKGPVRFTLGGGVGYYNGDLTSSLGDQFLGPSLSAGLLYQFHPHWQVGSEVSYLQLGAKDYLPDRGLAFRGNNAVGTAFVRWEPLRDPGAYSLPAGRSSIIKPYFKTGVGLALYSPKAYRGTQRPSGNFTPAYLEPERFDYPALALVLPVGVGVTIRLTSRLNATIEGSYSLTTTDQLDDISTVPSPGFDTGRSASSLNDNFGQLELKLEYAPWARSF
ncbi:outer membrane beta-barrel protein [Hymenobacter terrestris]|uniref:Outer membrane beta-barrel protein n=1 Tax=Hymenobacter terrestris TaxID=2748310 RepID=A0ABX2PZ35_9BACT|nr:outer membrane beta-barrel protein [Hymenobacter terrestris]NVO83947.1 outer membrane beta-barrel protein [Hymenobacter terrestris]